MGERGKTQRPPTASSSNSIPLSRPSRLVLACSMDGSTEFMIRASSADSTHPAILLQLLLLLLQTLRHVLLVHPWILHPQVTICTGELPIRGFCGTCLH